MSAAGHRFHCRLIIKLAQNGGLPMSTLLGVLWSFTPSSVIAHFPKVEFVLLISATNHPSPCIWAPMREAKHSEINLKLSFWFHVFHLIYVKAKTTLSAWCLGLPACHRVHEQFSFQTRYSASLSQTCRTKHNFPKAIFFKNSFEWMDLK